MIVVVADGGDTCDNDGVEVLVVAVLVVAVHVVDVDVRVRDPYADAFLDHFGAHDDICVVLIDAVDVDAVDGLVYFPVDPIYSS
jgi:hypothetical protein